MNQTTYKNHSVRSPIQPHHSAQPIRKAQREAYPMQDKIRKMCGTFNLTATFSEDTAALATLKTPGLIAVQCVLSKDGQAIGIGHGSSIISRINRATERTVFSCFNGSLMSAINSACKSLDVLRLDASDLQAEADKTSLYRDAYVPQEGSGFVPATDKQKQYLLQLASVNLDEGEREQFAATVDDMTKQEASDAIASFAR